MPPNITSAFSVTPNKIFLNWTAPCDETSYTCSETDDKPSSYIIMYSSSNDEKSKVVNRSSPSTLPDTTTTLDNLISNTKYSITVMTVTAFDPPTMDITIYSDSSSKTESFTSKKLWHSVLLGPVVAVVSLISTPWK